MHLYINENVLFFVLLPAIQSYIRYINDNDE